MDAAFAWLGNIMTWFGDFIPKVVVLPTTDRAVKFVGGSRVVAMEPGFHVYWKFRTRWVQLPVVAQTLDLRPQKLVTADDKTVLIGSLVSYEINDITKALAETWNVDATIKDAVLRAGTRVVLAHDWEGLKNEARKGTLDTKLRGEAQKALEPYGVRVLEMSLTDLAPTKVYSLAQATNVI